MGRESTPRVIYGFSLPFWRYVVVSWGPTPYGVYFYRLSSAIAIAREYENRFYEADRLRIYKRSRGGLVKVSYAFGVN